MCLVACSLWLLCHTLLNVLFCFQLPAGNTSISLVWISNFILALGECVLAGTFVTYYRTFDKKVIVWIATLIYSMMLYVCTLCFIHKIAYIGLVLTLLTCSNVIVSCEHM